MSVDKILIDPSSEFMDLCQSQIALLTQALKANWSVVYLRDSLTQGEQTKLIPVAAYPSHLDQLEEFEEIIDNKPQLLPSTTEVLSLNKQHQLVLPLIYDEVILGLLVTQKDKRNWTEKELLQIKNIARTIAIARVLDQRQNWYNDGITELEQIQVLKSNKLEDFFHQLRNPITALRTFSKLLLKRLLPSDPNQQVATSMLRESDRLQELTLKFQEDLKDLEAQFSSLSHLEAPPLLLPASRLVIEHIAVQQVLEPLLTSAKAIALERGINFNVNSLATSPVVLANGKALTEVLNNLIDNALKYTPEGGTVEVLFLEKTTHTQDFLAIGICDTGLGISPEDQKHLFKRHYRGEKARSEIAGSGLGLAIAQELVEQMEGKIELISPNPRTHTPSSLPGSLFLVWLKIAN